MSDTGRRRWRFSLRTLVFVVSGFALLLAYPGNLLRVTMDDVESFLSCQPDRSARFNSQFLQAEDLPALE